MLSSATHRIPLDLQSGLKRSDRCIVLDDHMKFAPAVASGVLIIMWDGILTVAGSTCGPVFQQSSDNLGL